MGPSEPSLMMMAMTSIGRKRTIRRAIDPQISVARFKARALPTVQFQAIILNELPNDERRLRGMIFTRKPFRFGWLLLDAVKGMMACWGWRLVVCWILGWFVWLFPVPLGLEEFLEDGVEFCEKG